MHRHLKWLSIILFLAVILRLIGFGTVPVSPYWDEMAIWDDAQSIIETGRDVHNRSWFQPIFISYGDFKLPVYIWLTGIVSIFVKDILPAVRLPSLFAGLSMVPGVFWLAHLLFPEKKWQNGPLLSALFIATMPWSIHFSRVGFEGHVGAAFLLWSAVSLWFGLRSTDRWRPWLSVLASVVLGSVAVYTYFSARFVYPVVFLAPLIFFWPLFRARWRQFVLGAGLWVLLLVPMYRADFYSASNQFRLSAASILNQPGQMEEINLWRQRSGNTLLSRVVFNRTTFITRDLAENYSRFLDPSYLWLSGDPNLRHGLPTNGVLFFATLPVFLIGILVLIQEKIRQMAYLAVWWLAAVLPAAVPTDVPHALRSLNALPIFAVILGIGGVAAWHWLEKTSLRRLVVAGFLSLLTLEVLRYQFTFLQVYPRLSGMEWQDGYLPVAKYVQQVRDEYTFVYVDNFDERFFLYYQPFSGLSWGEIQQMPSQGFQRSIFKNVHLGQIADWQALEHNSLVVTSPGRLPPGWGVKDEIIGAAGKERYVAVETIRD